MEEQDIINQLERVRRRLNYAIEEYQHRQTPNSRIEFNINQSIYTLEDIKNKLKFH